MKKLLAFAAAAVMSAGAYAAPVTLPAGPIYLKFSGIEQIALAGTTYAGTNEINWGVFVVTNMYNGVVDEPHDVIGGNTNAKFFENGQGGQITGMFYGIEKGVVTPGNPFPGTSGYLDLYWRDASLGAVATANAAPTIRTDFSHATGYTDGDFLARIKFDTGMDPVSSTNTIVGTAVPTTSRFSGFADSYGSVDMTAGGLWAQKLNSDWFVTPEGNRDLRFKNSYNNNARWNGAPGSNIVGANVDDPGQAFALPEPGALSLMGLSMLGMGAVLRRRQKSAK